MPFLQSPYRPALIFRAGDIQTIFPTLFRKVKAIPYQREVLATDDGDELELDWWRSEEISECRRPLAILAHGMEGSSESWYIRGMAHMLNSQGWDILAWNMRGCGGRPNRKVHFYHSGKTDDLRAVINHALKTHDRYALVGFSLGGNVVLKQVGEWGDDPAPGFIAAATVSVPIDLAGCAEMLAQRRNFIYQKRFLIYFHSKIRAKMKTMPGKITDKDFSKIQNLHDFDNRYTAPDFGYFNAEAYWQANSSKRFLNSIRKPTLLLTSLDDPFLSPSCYPRAAAESHEWFTLEQSRFGGHCGFIGTNLQEPYYGEIRIAQFLQQYLRNLPF